MEWATARVDAWNEQNAVLAARFANLFVGKGSPPITPGDYLARLKQKVSERKRAAAFQRYAARFPTDKPTDQATTKPTAAPPPKG